MKKLLLLVIVAVGLSASVASAQTVHTISEDWSDASNWTLDGWMLKPLETTDPAGSHAFVDVGAAGVTGQWLFAQEQDGMAFSATATFSDVPDFSSISIDKLIIGGGGGIDANHGDGMSLTVNGTEVFNVNLHGRNDASVNWDESYGGTNPETLLSTPATDDTSGGEFFSERSDGWGHDTLYDAGLDPNLGNLAVSGSGDVTILLEGRLTNGSGAMEANPDEQLGIGNMQISFMVPEPTGIALFSGFGALLFFRRRFKR